MPLLKNRLNAFTMLYLPKRIIRFKAKETKSVHKYELESAEFKRRQQDFVIIEDKKEEKPEVALNVDTSEFEEEEKSLDIITEMEEDESND